MLSCLRFRTTHSWPNARQPAVQSYVWTMDRFRGQLHQCRTHTWVWAAHRWWINCRVCPCLPQRHRPHRHKIQQLVNRLAPSCHNNSNRNNSQTVIWKHPRVSIQMPPPTRPKTMSDRNDNHNVNHYITLKWKQQQPNGKMDRNHHHHNSHTYTFLLHLSYMDRRVHTISTRMLRSAMCSSEIGRTLNLHEQEQTLVKSVETPKAWLCSTAATPIGESQWILSTSNTQISNSLDMLQGSFQ